MCRLERCTVSRTALCSAILARVCRARRNRDCLLSIMPSPVRSHTPALLLLGFLDDDYLIRVAHAFAFVRLRRTVATDLGGHLPDLLLVDTLDQDLGLCRRLDFDALWHVMHHGVRESQRQVESVSLRLSAITHTDQGQLALEPLGDPLDHIGE